jgi:hypothetical protein
MKQRIGALILIACIAFTACKKTGVKPGTDETPVVAKPVIGSVPIIGGADTLTSINGYLRLALAKDSINTDNTVINFKPTAKAVYVRNEDAPYLTGFGVVSLASMSSDNVPLAINAWPLNLPGVTINLKVNAKSDGVYTLKMQTINNIPDSFQIWLKDGYKKDSLDMRLYHSYAFNIYTADTASLGSHRFKLVVRKN